MDPLDSRESQREFEYCNSTARDYEKQQREKSEHFLRFQGRLFASKIEATKEGIVMDAGCGTGLVTEALAKLNRSIVAVDFSDASLEVLSEKNLPRTTIVQANLAKLPFPDNYFGGIVAAGVLQHIPPLERKTVFQQIARCLVPGGKLVSGVYTRDYFSKRKMPTEGSYKSGIPYYSFTHDEIRQAVEEAGLVSVAVRPYGVALHLRTRRGGWRFYHTFPVSFRKRRVRAMPRRHRGSPDGRAR